MAQQVSSNPKKCKNIFFEDDGYCTQCGKYHFAVTSGEVRFHKTPKPETCNGYELPAEVDDEDWDILARKI